MLPPLSSFPAIRTGSPARISTQSSNTASARGPATLGHSAWPHRRPGPPEPAPGCNRTEPVEIGDSPRPGDRATGGHADGRRRSRGLASRSEGSTPLGRGQVLCRGIRPDRARGTLAARMYQFRRLQLPSRSVMEGFTACRRGWSLRNLSGRRRALGTGIAVGLIVCQAAERDRLEGVGDGRIEPPGQRS